MLFLLQQRKMEGCKFLRSAKVRICLTLDVRSERLTSGVVPDVLNMVSNPAARRSQSRMVLSSVGHLDVMDAPRALAVLLAIVSYAYLFRPSTMYKGPALSARTKREAPCRESTSDIAG